MFDIEKNIPKHWQIKKLGEILKVSSGKGIKVNLLQGGDFPVYGGNGINGYHSEYFIEHPKLIIGRVGAKCGVTCITRPKSWVTDNALIVDPIISEFDIKFFQLKLEYENLNKLSVSTAQPVISGSKIYDYEILLPPLPEQLAIVSKIEELLSDLENGKHQLLIAQQQLKVYRQSLLKAAFENNGFEEYILSDTTQKIQIGPFGTQLHKEDYIDNGIPLINPMHIQNGIIEANYFYSIKEEKRNSLPNYILEEGDVIMGRRGEMGRCGLVTKNESGWFCGTGSLYFRPQKEKLNSLFLYYYLTSQPIKKYLTDNAGGTTMANLNLKIVNEIPIYLPSLKVQQQIVDELESKLTVCDNIEETIKEALLKSESLRQSILKKAFSGQLI